MIGRIYNYMGKWRAYGWAAVACVMAEAICELLVPMVMADMVDYGVVRGDIAYILQKGAVMLVFALCALVLGVGPAHGSVRVPGRASAHSCVKNSTKNCRRFHFPILTAFAFRL